MTAVQLLILWLAFFAGAAVQTFYWADRAVRVKKKFPTLRAYFAFYAFPLLKRGFITGLIFWAWVGNPDVLTKAFALAGITVDLDIPRVGVVAGMLGLGSDFLLHQLWVRVPFLRKEVPRLDDEEASPNET